MVDPAMGNDFTIYFYFLLLISLINVGFVWLLVFPSIELHLSNAVTFPDLSNNYSESRVTITTRNDDQIYKNKIQVVTNWISELKSNLSAENPIFNLSS